ncbi:ABC transporter-like protein [Neofusicoccum parvum]|nr:ABC transporter-like protein [Neofusicoccum parvum]
MKNRFRGNVVYNADVDCHFPHLTVAQTLDFALGTRTPHQRIGGLTRKEYIIKMRNILLATMGLTHTVNTKIGNDFIRGVSGGERKRVSIAEMMATRASVMYWDNPTRGLDSSTSLEFARSLRVATNLTQNVSVSALYQPGDGLVDVYDKGIVLYHGHQIWFGDLRAAKSFFEEMGFYCSPRATTAEFLTSITDPIARQVRPGFENKVPRTPEEFSLRWKDSIYYRDLMTEIQQHEIEFPREHSETLNILKDHQLAEKAPLTRKSSPYTLNLGMQFTVTAKRALQRIQGDRVYTMAMIVTMVIIALVVGSMFYNIPDDTSGFFSKGGVIYFSVLFNIIINFAEISAQFSQRPIVEKHKSFAMYHPFVDALATMIAQWPMKLMNVAIFSVIIYFLANFKQEAGPFFLFLLFNFLISVTMTGFFRTIAALVDTVETALGAAGLLMLPLAVYAGYIIPRPSMHPWFKWISYLNPIYYAIESQMIVEFHGRKAACAGLVPSGPGFEAVGLSHQVCAVTGAKPGQSYVSGDDYIEASFAYSYSHLWRNLGICIAFFIFFVFTYAVAVEYKQTAASKGEYLIFHRPLLDLFRPSEKPNPQGTTQRSEALTSHTVEPSTVAKSEDVFTWNHLDYSVDIKGEPRRLLSDVQGFVKPGTLTALMGESGAGKTTLLNVLAQRVTTGVVSGDVLVNGLPLGPSFQRRTGYVQQQDLHLAEATVREALRFSALLRQPSTVPVEEKYAYVEKIIASLGMQKYADAVIGVPGQGLNVEQRKRTTIGLELVAKPSLLLFLDEPTSGLDSQSAWAIIKFLRELADAGQAILCTIHQPSAALFEQFDRILLLAKGGKTVYFGDLGPDSKTLRNYYERNGARKCEDHENPAEYILDVIGGAAASSQGTQMWADAWRNSPEHEDVVAEIQQLETVNKERNEASNVHENSSFALPLHQQYFAVQKRLFQQYWRSPAYIQGKLIMYVLGGLFIGFTFWKEKTSAQGLQNKVFAIYMMLLVCLVVVVQLQPRLIAYRELYDVRERHSKMYHWTVFVVASFIVELPFNIVIASLCYVAWYFPIGWWHTISAGRGATMWLIFLVYQLYHSSFSQTITMLAPDAETAAMLTILFYTFILAFSGVVQPLLQLVKFWHFAYYVSPFTWLVAALMTTGAHDVPVNCAAVEVNVFQPPDGQTCGEYASAFAAAAGGAVYNPLATADCQYCRYAVADVFLQGLNMVYADRWRNLGYLCAYTAFNVGFFFVAYYLHSEIGFGNLLGYVNKALRLRGPSKRN